MSDYLTTHQAEDLLRVDRATIYRMLRDGRLKGSKIGSQWRFLRADVERMLRGETRTSPVLLTRESSVLPVDCIQTIQDMFSQVSQLGAMLLDQDGDLITQVSSPNPVCQLILGSRSGREACLDSWRSFAQQSRNGINRFTCHAGLNYLGVPVMLPEGPAGLQNALFVIGPFYWQSPDAEEEARRMRHLAELHRIAYVELAGAAHTVPIIPPERHAQVEDWARAVSRAVQSVVQERAQVTLRMQQIASLTQIP